MFRYSIRSGGEDFRVARKFSDKISGKALTSFRQGRKRPSRKGVSAGGCQKSAAPAKKICEKRLQSSLAYAIIRLAGCRNAKKTQTRFVHVCSCNPRPSRGLKPAKSRISSQFFKGMQPAPLTGTATWFHTCDGGGSNGSRLHLWKCQLAFLSQYQPHAVHSLKAAGEYVDGAGRQSRQTAPSGSEKTARYLDQRAPRMAILQIFSGLFPRRFLFDAKNLLLLRLCAKNDGFPIIIIAQTAAKWEVFLSAFFLSALLRKCRRRRNKYGFYPMPTFALRDGKASIRISSQRNGAS